MFFVCLFLKSSGIFVGVSANVIELRLVGILADVWRQCQSLSVLVRNSDVALDLRWDIRFDLRIVQGSLYQIAF